mgnify:FL=1
MEKFYLESPSIKRKDEAINYVKEFYENNSNLNGDSGLDKYLDDYEGWLEFLNKLSNPLTVPSGYCLGYEYFLIRKNDSKLVGLINLRHNLNKNLLLHGGHIGYSIKVTERRKGYNKINLYLCLIKARELGLDKVLLTAYDDNIGSVKTILDAGGVLENKINDSGKLLGRYWIDVEESLKKNIKYKKYTEGK